MPPSISLGCRDSHSSTQARQARRGRLPSTSYAALRYQCDKCLPASRPLSSIIESLVRGSRFLDRSLRRLLHARGLSRSVDDSGRDLPTRRPDCQSKVALSALAILLREAPHRCPTSHRIAAKKSTATAAGGCPITGRGTRKHTSTTELGAPPARPPPKCRRRARRWTSCRGCAAF